MRYDFSATEALTAHALAVALGIEAGDHAEDERETPCSRITLTGESARGRFLVREVVFPETDGAGRTAIDLTAEQVAQMEAVVRASNGDEAARSGGAP